MDTFNTSDSGALSRKRKQADTRMSSIEDIGSESKRIHRAEADKEEENEATPTTAHAAANDETLEVDEFRIRLQRSAAISRRFAQEAAHAQAQAVVEKQKFVAVLRKAEAVKHKRRVSDVVVKAQCAVIASPGSSFAKSSKKKRAKIEQLSSAQDACWSSPGFHHVVAPDIRIPRLSTRRTSIPTPSPLLSAQAVKKSTMDDDLVNLFKKIEAFKKVVSSSSATRAQTCDEGAAVNPDEDAPEYVFDAPSISDAKESAPPATTTVPVSTVQHETRVTGFSNGRRETQPQENRRESFRSTWDVPGLSRDLNLVQDYSGESDCKLLQLVVGERQYFYMEPLLLDHGMENQETLKRWILTEHDVQLVCSFLSENDQYGKQVVQSIDETKQAVASSASSSSSELFQSSKKPQWSATQRQLVNVHSLTLAAHLLGYHYHAMQSLRGGVDTSSSSSGHAAPTLTGRDVLTDETLKSDLFKFILRPIRSSAIESSLLDSLPISLVRETVGHCPEVLNHVLNWKEEDDIPADVAQDIRSTKAAKGSSSAYLHSLMERLSAHVAELDGVLASLGEKVRRELDQQASESPQERENVIFLTNQLKDVTAKIVVENIKLQLHKWATVFLENSCSWFDSDFDDSMGYGSDGDRTYDKFTCLQDALFVWHNQKVLYSAKDDLADMQETRATENGVVEQTRRQQPLAANGTVAPSVQASRTAGGGGVATTQPRSLSATGNFSDNDASSTAAKAQAALEPTPSENELAALKSLTPASMLEKLENHFTLEDISKHYMSLLELHDTRKQLHDSLLTMKTLMDVMGRSAPWRTHVKNSNALKRELAKQAAMEKKLLLHQWGFYYKRHQGKVAKTGGAHAPANKPTDAEDAAGGASGDGKRNTQENPEPDVEQQPKSIDWTGVFDANDSADVVMMKKLRHELQVTNSELAKHASSGDAKDPLNAEHRALMKECNALTRSCVAALSKFLGESVDDEVAAHILASSEASAPPRRRARSRSVIIPDELRSTGEPLNKPGPKNEKPISQAVQASTSNKGEDGAEEMEIDSTGPVESTTSTRAKSQTSAPLAKGAAPKVAKSSGDKQVAEPPVVKPVTTSGPKSAARKSPTVRTQSRVNPAPLRMGCSGCRDLRRRCTGCFGCCLHCVCVSCGCRMCCSTRFLAVQKTLAMLVSCVEANDGCKWVQAKPRSSSVSSDTDGAGAAQRNDQFPSKICGMLRICFKCLYCGSHCTCPRPTVTKVTGGHARIGLRGRPAATRRERRFKAKLAPTQRRTPVSSDGSANDQDTPMPGPSPRDRRGSVSVPGDSNGMGAPASAPVSAPTPVSSPPPPSAETVGEGDAIPLPNRSDEFTGFPNPPPPLRTGKDQGKTEQEDLFRAARVRMKLQRNTFSMLHSLYGSIPANTFLDGDVLWQPERIRMMWERKDLFGVLGVPRDATTQQIKRQYRKLALKLHPDKTMDIALNSNSNAQEGDYHSSTADERVEAFVAVTHAYKLLSGDPATLSSNIWKPSM